MYSAKVANDTAIYSLNYSVLVLISVIFLMMNKVENGQPYSFMKNEVGAV